MVRGMKRSRLLPSGVTPPPIISAIEPVTTTAGRSWSLRRGGALHRALGAGLGEGSLVEAGHHHGEFVRRQGVGVVKDGGDGQVLAADRAVDHGTQAAHGAEGIDGAPVAAGAIVVEDEHRASSPPLRRP
jgi:hypothetical protein